MSKHQSCFGCHRQFVGPDSDINFNYCPDCASEIHKDCYAETEALQARLQAQEKELAEYKKGGEKRLDELAKSCDELRKWNEKAEAENTKLKEALEQVQAYCCSHHSDCAFNADRNNKCNCGALGAVEIIDQAMKGKSTDAKDRRNGLS